jgi:hypothetical protein
MLALIHNTIVDLLAGILQQIQMFFMRVLADFDAVE